jgi:hypothetical protein
MITGINEFNKLLDKVGKIPASSMTKVIKPIAKSIQINAKSNAPVGETGNLKKAIGIFAERRKVGKKVYQIAFSKKYNEVFSSYKKGSHTKIVGKRKLVGKSYYYPASQEYGFKLRNGRKKEGKHFMQNAVKSKSTILEMIVAGLANSLKEAGA